jgi:hypothetical protein
MEQFLLEAVVTQLGKKFPMFYAAQRFLRGRKRLEKIA